MSHSELLKSSRQNLESHQICGKVIIFTFPCCCEHCMRSMQSDDGSQLFLTKFFINNGSLFDCSVKRHVYNFAILIFLLLWQFWQVLSFKISHEILTNVSSFDVVFIKCLFLHPKLVQKQNKEGNPTSDHQHPTQHLLLIYEVLFYLL